MDHQELHEAHVHTAVRSAARGDSRPPVVGMIGAGQLARMTAAAAIGLDVRFRVLAAAPDESAAQVVADTVLGDHTSTADLLAFAAGCDAVTFDHEHVPQPQLAALEQAGFAVRPGASALRFTQDKLAMRERLLALGVPCPRFAPVSSLADVVAFDQNRKLVPANRWQVFEERTFRSRRSDLPEPREALVTDVTGDGKNDLVVLVHDRILVYPQEK